MTHEVIHFCLSKLNLSEELDEEQEEKLIFMMAWAADAL
jgi:hypothetical protein